MGPYGLSTDPRRVWQCESCGKYTHTDPNAPEPIDEDFERAIDQIVAEARQWSV